MNKFLILTSLFLAACGANTAINQNPLATATPTNIQDDYLYSTSLYGSEDAGPAANIAVLLPMTGENKATGNSIKTSIETAFLRKPKQNIKVSFFDLSGNKEQRDTAIQKAINTDPDIIIGPLFASDTQTLRHMKKPNTPAISFTSDVDALGNNVATLNLIPTQSIETIIQQIKKDGATKILILAPNDKSGEKMVSVAVKASSIYDSETNGIFYYNSGDSESIKNTAMRASMYNARTAANTRAREVLSDILTKESLTSEQKKDLTKQLEKISRTETLGHIPYDAILFLGNGEDSKTLASFLRYYGVGARDAAFYGTTLWSNSDIASDFTMSGAKYATLPDISESFSELYNSVSGSKPDYLASFGFDATNLALGMIYSNKSQSAYLFDPSGYIGTTGIFRIQPSGESERGLKVMELNGSGTAETLKSAPENFIVPLYNVGTTNLKYIPEQELSTRGINPGDYITIPENLRQKAQYKTKTIGANYVADQETPKQNTPIQIYESEEKETVSNPEWSPVKLESVSREYIDSVEIEE